jgi:hypothetical protein|tara:strand:+ start:3435 stop:3950 length:516 start_codon:yes stop_codon:yes gene_type:complete
MGIPSNYRKSNDKPTFYYHEKPKKGRKRKPKDSLPKGMTVEEFKAKYAKVVWCDYYACIHNESPEGASRKIATILENPHYEPLGTKDESWKGVCGTDKTEIAIRFKTVQGTSGSKDKVPECFNAASNKTGRIDMSKLLQGNGTPYGGSIESQSADQGFTGTAAYGTKWKGK